MGAIRSLRHIPCGRSGRCACGRKGGETLPHPSGPGVAPRPQRSGRGAENPQGNRRTGPHGQGRDHHRKQRESECPESRGGRRVRLLRQAARPGGSENHPEAGLESHLPREGEHRSQRKESTFRIRGYSGGKPSYATGLLPGTEGCTFRRLCPDRRGKRHRQGTDREGDPRLQQQAKRAVYRHQLRGDSGEPPRKRAFRA